MAKTGLTTVLSKFGLTETTARLNAAIGAAGMTVFARIDHGAAALNEPVGEPAWKTIPSWFLYGSLDKNIPPRVDAFMAKRAGAKEVVEIQGASHVVMMSHPQALANLIERAAEQGQQ